MKFVDNPNDVIVLELDTTDLLALADCCDWAIRHDMPLDYTRISAFATAFKCATLAGAAPGMMHSRHRAELTLDHIRGVAGLYNTAPAEPVRAGTPADPDREG